MPTITVALRQLRAPTLSSRQSGGYTEECCAVRAEAGGKASEGKNETPSCEMCDPSACGLCFNGRHCDSYSSNLHNKQSYYHRHANWKNSKENLTFLIDEASKKISFADGVPLSIQRFDDRWISVTGGGVSYEFDRESRSLSFAGHDHEGRYRDDHNRGRYMHC